MAIQIITITHQEFERLRQVKLYIAPDGKVIKLPSNVLRDLLTEGAATLWYLPHNAYWPAALKLEVKSD